SCSSFTSPSTSHLYPLSLHDALPICCPYRDCGTCPFPYSLLVRVVVGLRSRGEALQRGAEHARADLPAASPGNPDVHDGGYAGGDRKSTRLNSSHDQISYAVFCLKKK